MPRFLTEPEPVNSSIDPLQQIKPPGTRIVAALRDGDPPLRSGPLTSFASRRVTLLFQIKP